MHGCDEDDVNPATMTDDTRALRFFKYSDGHVRYLVVASDLDTAKVYLFDGGADVRPPTPGDDYEHFTWSEVAPDEAARINVLKDGELFDDRPGRIPLTQCADGEWFCSEW